MIHRLILVILLLPSLAFAKNEKSEEKQVEKEQKKIEKEIEKEQKKLDKEIEKLPPVVTPPVEVPNTESPTVPNITIQVPIINHSVVEKNIPGVVGVLNSITRVFDNRIIFPDLDYNKPKVEDNVCNFMKC